MMGNARISFDPGIRFAKIFLKISENFFTVTGVTLNLVEAGKNGDVAIHVEGFSSDPIIDRTFTIAEVINPTEVNRVDTVVNIASLYQVAVDEKIYVVVTSAMYPEGEIRGHIFP